MAYGDRMHLPSDMVYLQTKLTPATLVQLNIKPPSPKDSLLFPPKKEKKKEWWEIN